MEMDKQTVSFIIFLIGVVTKYGAPAVKNLIEYIDKEKITQEDLESLVINKNPEEFFED